MKLSGPVHLSVLFLCILTSVWVFGDTFIVPGTGFTASGTALASGAVDENWVLNGSDDAYFIAPGNPDWWGGYVANTNASTFMGSGWISNSATSSLNGAAPYTFSVTFDLTGYDLSTVSISGLWAIADGGTLDINGHIVATLAAQNVPDWTEMHAFTITDPTWFVDGLNTITMTVTASDDYYEAARFEGTGTGSKTGPSPIPEPASIVLLGTGLIGISNVLRRKLR